MSPTIATQLGDFTEQSTFDRLPAAVVEECKRLLLDSMGCAVAATEQPKGQAGIAYGRLLGAGAGDATIMGTTDRASVFGAAFANGELINALDMDNILFPGHVTPYVLPGAVAVAESGHASGRTLLEALAVAHEMSFRFGKAMDNLRDTKDGKLNTPKIFGYASTIFGATAAIGKVKAFSSDRIAQALGIAAYISPVNPQIAWNQHAPSTTIKYLMAGMLAQQALTAAHMAEFGHRGDVRIFDNREFGYPRFIGTTRWEPEQITDGLGRDWRFPAFLSYKPYPHCRILHGLLDVLTEIVTANDIAPEEIESIKVFVEGFTEQPVWVNRTIEHVQDAQFSIAHGISVGAHRVPPGKAWQEPALVFGASVMSLMDRVSHEVHPDYVKLLNENSASRPARLELRARGTTFAGEKRYPKGSPSPEPDSRMTDDELAAKFRHNAEGVMAPADIDRLVDAVFSLESVGDVAPVIALAAGQTAGAGTRQEAAAVAR